MNTTKFTGAYWRSFRSLRGYFAGVYSTATVCKHTHCVPVQQRRSQNQYTKLKNFLLMMSSVQDANYSHSKINSTIFKSIFTPEVKALQEICERHQMEIRIAGGAVRDILLGIVPHDIDFATTSHPEQMVEIFTKEGVRLIEYGARAIGHGTVSVRINDKVVANN